MARRHKKHEEEEHVNHERWLVTYADMITLLMVLFIVMFAMSTVDQKKFNALKSGLAAGFGQSTSLMDGSSSILEEPGAAPVEQIRPSVAQESKEITEIKLAAVDEAERLRNQRRYAEAQAEASRLEEIRRTIMAALAAKGLDGDVRSTIDGRGLTIGLVSRHVVFDANLATLTPRGRAIVDTMAPVLRDLPDLLQIEGHTNQAPGAPAFYASDWDLSAARAVTVLRHLNEVDGVPAARLAAVAFGKIKPLIDPRKPGSQELNKRVDIVVLSSLAEENEQMLEDAARSQRDRRKPSGATREAGTIRQTSTHGSARAASPAHSSTDTHAPTGEGEH